MPEVKRVIKGEPIRTVEEKLLDAIKQESEKTSVSSGAAVATAS